MYKIKLLLLSAFVSVNASAQTKNVRVFQYNLLSYGDASNPTTYKDSRLKTIINHVQPDIFGANEIHNSPAMSNNILSNVLGSSWEKAAYSNTNNAYQTNMLFWKSDKFSLQSQIVIVSHVRDIIAYRLYYKDTTARTDDSVFLTAIVCHLKAGEGGTDEVDRGNETKALVNYLNSLGKEANYILMGDLNLYSSDEPAYKNIINNTNKASKFNDPINRPGQWHSNNSFSGIHTQSTRTVNLSDNGVSGGLDDRFDFILVSDAILSSKLGVRYIPGSYKTIGQDGNHYNRAVNAAPQNTSAPANVIQALYEFSDHLPVSADFVFQPTGVSIEDIATDFASNFDVTNPFNDDLFIKFSNELINKEINIELYNANGIQVTDIKHTVSGELTLPLSQSLPQGVYMIRIHDAEGNSATKKLIKY